MDCEKFEATMLDELYGELDELTLAASRRHVGGCARCAALIGGLRATRKVVTLPAIAPSEGFEARILAAVREAEAKPKLGFAELISLAGRWAMRPQTAMAAVLLLMIGTSSVLVSRRAPRSATEAASSSFTVTENGAPAPAAPRPESTPQDQAKSVDPRLAAAAHGTAPFASAAPQFAAKPAAASPTGALEAPAERELASADTPLPDEVGRLSSAKSAGAGPFAAAPPSRQAAGPGFGSMGGGASRSGGRGEASGPAAADLAGPAAPGAAIGGQRPPSAQSDDDAFASARRQYRDGDYGGAARSFDGLAASGDPLSALWAARSVRDGAGGCASAVARFDQTAAAAWGSPSGYDATLEGAQCYARLGRQAEARSRYGRLLGVAAYASRAQSGMDAMSMVAAKARPIAPKAAAAPAAAAPAAPPAASPTVPSATQK